MIFLWLVALVLLQRGHGTEVFVEIIKDIGAGTYTVLNTFSYSKPFTRTSANVPSEGIRGHILWNVRELPCRPQRTNASWIALVAEFSEGQAVELLRAGCAALVAPLNTNNTRFLRRSPLPTILVDRAVTEYIIAQPQDQAIGVHIRTSSTVEVVVLSVCTGLGLICLFGAICLTWFCCRRHDNRADGRPRHQPARGLQDSIVRHIRQLQAEDPNQIQVPLGPELTKHLPTSRYKKQRDSSASCVVCMCDYKNRDKVRTLSCGHFFHVACIDEWLIKYSSLCPLCKKGALGQHAAESSFSLSASVQGCEEDTPQLLGNRRGRQTYGGVDS